MSEHQHRHQDLVRGRVAGSDRVDELDKQLIALLQVNGRMSYADLSRETGISDAAARTRVQRLLRDGVFQIVAVTDPLQLGFAHEALVAIQVTADPEAVADRLAEIDEVDFVVLVTGSFDILLEIVSPGEEEFLAVMRMIRNVAGEATIRVLPYLKTWKQEYAWGVR